MDDEGAARFDLDLSRSARVLGENAAFRVLTGNLNALREEFVQSLVEGKDGANEFRRAIKLIDTYHRLYNQMASAGDRAGQWLGDHGYESE